MARTVYLTTIDNPFDPHTQFDEWYLFDQASGYDTCGYLARITKTSSGLSDADQQEAIETAIDQIIRIDPMKIYKKIVVES